MRLPEKRNKRPPRGQSPAITSTPVTPALNNLQKITLPARNRFERSLLSGTKGSSRGSGGAVAAPRRSKVAFHPPSGSGTNGPADESTWILAVVTKCINQDKSRSVFPLPPLSERSWISGRGATGGRPTRGVSTENA